jgi:hypothetical protein
LRFDPAPESGASRNDQRFILYVEGPRDRSILRAWSYRLLPSPARRLFRASVILGGRRPVRAVEHFRDERGAQAGARGLCVLDRDDGTGSQPPEGAEPGLEFFTWSRRHIESYLLVPDAIRRALGLPDDDARIGRVLREYLPPGADEHVLRDVDAKRLLGPNGALALSLGRPLPLSRIARFTREAELHADVHALFARLRTQLAAGPSEARSR